MISDRIGDLYAKGRELMPYENNSDIAKAEEIAQKMRDMARTDWELRHALVIAPLGSMIRLTISREVCRIPPFERVKRRRQLC